MEVPYRTF